MIENDIPLFRRPWWERNPEIAAFVRGLFGTMRVVDMPGAVAAKFGPDLAPSKSGIARFMTDLRGGPRRRQKRSRGPEKSRLNPINPV